jgi:hypothetical protein
LPKNIDLDTLDEYVLFVGIIIFDPTLRGREDILEASISTN